MKIVNIIPRLKVNLKEKQYDLWWNGGIVFDGNLKSVSERMEYYISYYAKDYFLAGFEKDKFAVLRNRELPHLVWKFEIKEAQ